MGIDGSWHNVCKNTTDACKPISSWFSSSQEFCEGIFPGDYQVVDQKDICIEPLKKRTIEEGRSE